MLHSVLQTAAFIGIIFGKILSAFSQGIQAGFVTPHRTILEQQNNVMLSHLLSVQVKLLSELLGNSQESDTDDRPVSEISSSPEHVETLRMLMDGPSEEAVKAVSIWASGTASNYSLKLKRVTLETERSTEPGRDHDIILVFHMTGAGSDALRFQAEATRQLREIAANTPAPSVMMLRIDVRWTSA